MPKSPRAVTRKNYLSMSTSQLIMQVSKLMEEDKPIPKRNREALNLADHAPRLLEALEETVKAGHSRMAYLHLEGLSAEQIKGFEALLRECRGEGTNHE